MTPFLRRGVSNDGHAEPVEIAVMKIDTTDRLNYVIQCESEEESTSLMYMLTLFELLRSKPQIPDSLTIWWSLEGVRKKLQDSIKEKAQSLACDALNSFGRSTEAELQTVDQS